MSQPLDELYLTWLYQQVGSVKLKNASRTYWSLLRQLYSKEFVWLIPNDDNRVEDGRDLRNEFIETERLGDIDPDWLGLGCSMLEMLIGLSRRLSFEAEGEPRDWFWHLMDNLGFRVCTDAVWRDDVAKDVNDICDRVIWRVYRPNGAGGLFPLHNPKDNQRDVEIWYQLSAYLLELN